MTVGPWKPISLETYVARIVDLDVRGYVSEDLSASLDVTFSLSTQENGTALVNLKSPDGVLVAGQSNIKINTTDTKAQFSLSPGTFDLWYPVRYGKQPLYTVEVQVADSVNSSLVSSPSVVLITRDSARSYVG